MSVWKPFRVNAECCLAVVACDDGSGIEQIRFDGQPVGDVSRDDDFPLLKEAARQMEAYFAGDLRKFELPLKPRGTEFQKRVWESLSAIPYGETRTYSSIAQTIGSPKAVRAVGAANGQNPIPIIVPCHRVIGSSGKLVGFGGGLEMKRLLLDLEGGPR